MTQPQPQPPAAPINPVQKFKDFFRTFQDTPGEYKYQERIKDIAAKNGNTLTFLYEDLLSFNSKIAEMLRTDPEELLDDAVEAFKDILKFQSGKKLTYEKYFVRIGTEDPKSILNVKIRGLRSTHIDELVWLKGIIIRSSRVRPKLKKASFECLVCGTTFEVVQITSKVKWPRFCMNKQCKAKAKSDFRLVTKQSEFIDWQSITIQEVPEDLPAGRMPRSVQAILTHDLVDYVKPGDRVNVLGIYKSVLAMSMRNRNSTLFKTFIKVNYIDPEDKSEENTDISKEEKEEIEELAKEPKIQKKISRSIAPSIYGREDLKMACALSLFGGTKKRKAGGGYKRGDIHILFVGDPGTGKSEILKDSVEISPRGLYTSGKGSTAVGLCVSGDSNVYLSDNMVPISNIVENEFQKGKTRWYNEKIRFKENSTNHHVLNSKNLKIKPDEISKVWKIKSPSKLIKITTRTGRELKLTKQTPVLSIDENEGLIWKPSNNLNFSDRVATLRRLKPSSIKLPPTLYELIKDYPNSLYIYNINRKVRDAIYKIKKKLNLTDKQLADEFNVSESTIHRWKKSYEKFGFSLKHLERISSLLNENVEKLLPDRIDVQIKRGQTISLPNNLNGDWFYILGLIVGDGRVSIHNHEDSYGGVTIGFSNQQQILLEKFKTFFKKLNLNVNITEKSKIRPSECRVFSSLIYHIFSKFGLSKSPKSSNIDLNPQIIYYPKLYLYNLLRGLYDSDGWISIGSSSHIGFSSTSKSLINFVQNSLLRLGIIAYIRKRPPKKTVLKNGCVIRGKKVKYELLFSAFDEFLIFRENIGFNHPKKKKLLSSYCKRDKKPHRNVDNIPKAPILLKKILEFYEYTSREIFGYKGALAPSNVKESMSKNNLSQILNKIKLDWKRHKVYLGYEIRNQFYKEVSNSLSEEKILELTDLSKTQLYEYFKRKNRKVRIPIKIFVSLLEEDDKNSNSDVKRKLLDLIEEIKKQDKLHKKTFNLLKNLCNSDLYWDEIKEITEIESSKPFVYDLSVPNSHNFVVNGIVVHNTAAVIKDADTGQMNLEAGAMVLANGGIAAIDEFDKMDSADRSALHESMEQQTISIAKAGIVATLKAETAVVAAANPHSGRYDIYATPTQNIRLPPSLLSRFDLIFVVIDRPNQQKDAQVAEFILRNAMSDFDRDTEEEEEDEEEIVAPISHDLLKKYIKYAKKNCHPLLTSEAKDRIKNFYLELRGEYESEDAIISILARNLDALVRLSEAHAKMALRDKVEKSDVEEIIKLFKRYLKDTGYDEKTGKIDMDRVLAGESRVTLNKIDAVLARLKEIFEENEWKMLEKKGVIQILDLELEDVDKEFIKDAIEELVQEGTLYKPRPGHIKFTSKEA